MMSFVPTPFQIIILSLLNLGETQAASPSSSTKQKAAKNGAGRRKGGKGGKGGKRKTGALKVSGGGRKRSGGAKRNKTKGKRGGAGGSGGRGRGKKNKKKGGAGAGGKNSVADCPGGALAACVELCPGKLGARVYGACVASCDKRC